MSISWILVAEFYGAEADLQRALFQDLGFEDYLNYIDLENIRVIYDKPEGTSFNEYILVDQKSFRVFRNNTAVLS